MFETQNSLPMEIVLEAIENTNVMSNTVEELEFDTQNKYPLLYGDKDEEVLWNVLKTKYKEKLATYYNISKEDIKYVSIISLYNEI